MKRTKPFFITRQRLAEKLAMSGIEVFPCPNIYDPDRPAWKCALTKEAAMLIQEEYRELGREIPALVQDALKQ